MSLNDIVITVFSVVLIIAILAGFVFFGWVIYNKLRDIFMKPKEEKKEEPRVVEAEVINETPQ